MQQSVEVEDSIDASETDDHLAAFAPWVGPLTILLAAVMGVVYATHSTIGDFYHMLRPMQNLLGGELGSVYPVDVDGTSLSGWLVLTVVPFALSRLVFTDDLSWILAGLVAVPLLVGGVRYAARALHPQMSVRYAWGLAAVSLVLPTTVSCWTEYYHPQDAAAVGLMLFAIGFAAKNNWATAGAMFGFAILTRHWILLIAIALAPMAGKQLWRYIAFGGAVVAVGVLPLVALGNEGLLDAITAKNAMVVDQTVMGNILNRVEVISRTFPTRVIRGLPLVAAVALAGLVAVKRWRGVEYLVPIAVTAIGLRFVFETAPYTYYWVPVPVLLLVATRRYTGLLAGVAMALLVWPLRTIGGTGPLGASLVAGLFLTMALLAILLAWQLRETESPSDRGANLLRRAPSPTPVTGWITTSVVIVALLAGSTVAFGGNADRMIMERQEQAEQATNFKNVDFAEVEVDATPDAILSIQGTTPTGQPFVWAAEKPTVVAVWAHWCAACTAELPEFETFLASAGDAVDGFAVFTDARPDAGNWPTSLWLQSAGWDSPSVLDDEVGTIRSALGVVDYPGYVVIVDGVIVDRMVRFNAERINAALR